MLDLFATAHTWNGGDGPYTVAPLVGTLLTLLLLRSILRVRVGLAAVGISAGLGTIFATFGGRWGYTLTVTFWVLAVAVLAAIRRSAGTFRRNVSD